MDKHTYKQSPWALAFACTALAATFPAVAHASDGQPTEKVHYEDLNLTTQAGIDALDRRLDSAVTRVCGTAAAADVHRRTVVALCKRRTWASIQSERQVAIARANDAARLAQNSQGNGQVTNAE